MAHLSTRTITGERDLPVGLWEEFIKLLPRGRNDRCSLSAFITQTFTLSATAGQRCKPPSLVVSPSDQRRNKWICTAQLRGFDGTGARRSGSPRSSRGGTVTATFWILIALDFNKMQMHSRSEVRVICKRRCAAWYSTERRGVLNFNTTLYIY